jgi:hypothetical protein
VALQVFVTGNTPAVNVIEGLAQESPSELVA